MLRSGGPALAASLPQEEDKVLCGPECTSNLEQLKTVNLPSGLQFKEIREGTGPSPPVGFQVILLTVELLLRPTPPSPHFAPLFLPFRQSC